MILYLFTIHGIEFKVKGNISWLRLDHLNNFNNPAILMCIVVCVLEVLLIIIKCQFCKKKNRTLQGLVAELINIASTSSNMQLQCTQKLK